MLELQEGVGHNLTERMLVRVVRIGSFIIIRGAIRVVWIVYNLAGRTLWAILFKEP